MGDVKNKHENQARAQGSFDTEQLCKTMHSLLQVKGGNILHNATGRILLGLCQGLFVKCAACTYICDRCWGTLVLHNLYLVFAKFFSSPYINRSNRRVQTSRAKAAHYPNIEQTPIYRVSKAIQITQKIINCFLHHCTAILKLSSKSAHSLLSNGRISDWVGWHGDPDRYQNLITCSFYHPEPLHKI